MNTIKEDVINEIIINKSRFITILYRINNIQQALEKLKNIKNKYKDATHYCYAYIVDNKEKCSDDGEPSRTAGIPILNILKQKQLTNILCITVRYFGGIKLGSGGLIRAYSTSANEAVAKSTLIKLIKGYKITIEFSYENIKKIDFLLKNIPVKKNYSELITYTFEIKEEDFLKIENNLKLISNIKTKEQIITS